MRLLCIAAQGTPYGHVTINGRPASVDELAKIVRAKPTFVARLIAELERKGVCSRDACGCLVSRRQESDGKLAGIRAKAANSRWHKENGADLHMQTTPFASTESDAELDAKDSPPTPRKRGANGRGLNSHKQEFRNGFAASAAADMQETIDHAEAADARPGGARVVSIAGRAHRRFDDKAGS